MVTEYTVREASQRLDVSQQRVREMLRAGELSGRQIAHVWLADSASVQERARIHVRAGRPWSEETVARVVDALSDRQSADTAATNLIAQTSADSLWRKIAQTIVVRRFTSVTGQLGLVREHLSLTGENAMEAIGQPLVGETGAVHGYLHGLSVAEIVDDAGLVDNVEGDIHLYMPKSGNAAWVTPRRAQRALIAVDCARSSTTRVNGAGLAALMEMRTAWLAQNT